MILFSKALSVRLTRGDIPCLGQITKNDVRQRLAYVTTYYPKACPARGMLKQVYAFFQQEQEDNEMKLN